jgi:ribosomal RNA-processing protein 12
MEQDVRSQRSAGRSSIARTARRSEWAHTKIFSEDGALSSGGGSQEGPGRVVRPARPRSIVTRRVQPQSGSAVGRLVDMRDEPMDLLDGAASRQLSRSAAGTAPTRSVDMRGEDGFERDPASGRLVINDEEAAAEAKAERKRKRAGDDYDSDDSDFDDLRGHVRDLDAAMRSAARSVRVAGIAPSTLGAQGAIPPGSGVSRLPPRQRESIAHSGERYKPKSSAAGGDMRGKSSIEPYAYWALDRRMLNRRQTKRSSASKGLANVVAGARTGAVKGAKARFAHRQRTGAKRVRT